MSETIPLSRPLLVSSVPAEGLSVEVVADEAERLALAAVNEVESVERLVARFDVRPRGRDGLSVEGALEALATRLCVVTLEPFAEEVREAVEIRFAPAESISPESDDPPDPIVGGSVDLGAVAAEFFTLGLDPHPKKPGAAFDTGETRDESASPFAALRSLPQENGPSS